MIELLNNDVLNTGLLKNRSKENTSHQAMDKEIKKNINVWDSLYSEFVKKVNPVIRNNLYHQYKACRNQFVAAIRQRKKLKFVNFFNNNTRNSKKNREIKLTNLKSRSKSDSSNFSIKIGERVFSDSKTVANEFDEYLSSIADRIRYMERVTKIY